MKTISFPILIFLSIISILTFNACEKVIDIDLNESNPQLVIEALVLDSMVPATVKISQTASFYEYSDYVKINNAVVNISDSDGHIFPLNSIGNGIYTSDSLFGNSGKEYRLNVVYNGQVITSESTIPQKINIDSLSYKPFELGFGDEEMFMVYLYFNDPVNIENFYRFKIYKNGLLENGLRAYNDQYINGQNAKVNVGRYEKGDTVYVEMFSVDYANYLYFKTLSDASGSDNPGNPVSNLEGENCLGYFGAYAFSFDTIVIR